MVALPFRPDLSGVLAATELGNLNAMRITGSLEWQGEMGHSIDKGKVGVVTE